MEEKKQTKETKYNDSIIHPLAAVRLELVSREKKCTKIFPVAKLKTSIVFTYIKHKNIRLSGQRKEVTKYILYTDNEQNDFISKTVVEYRVIIVYIIIILAVKCTR